jgi:hypothetical protein
MIQFGEDSECFIYRVLHFMLPTVTDKDDSDGGPLSKNLHLRSVE